MVDQYDLNHKPQQPPAPNVGLPKPTNPEIQKTNISPGSSQPAQNQKILLIDDDPSLIRLYQMAFKARGFNYSTALTGTTGLEKINLERPALILLDIMLPDIDGFEILRRMKTDPQISKIPVWMLTNLGDQTNKNKAVSMGATEYIVKAQTTPNQICEKILSHFNTGVANDPPPTLPQSQ